MIRKQGGEKGSKGLAGPNFLLEKQKHVFQGLRQLFCSWTSPPDLPLLTLKQCIKTATRVLTNHGKPGGIIHCFASVCFCFDLWCNCPVQTIALSHYLSVPCISIVPKQHLAANQWSFTNLAPLTFDCLRSLCKKVKPPEMLIQKARPCVQACFLCACLETKVRINTSFAVRTVYIKWKNTKVQFI